MTKEERLNNAIRKGIELLKDQKGYNQKNIVQKADALQYKFSESSLTNIVSSKKTVGMQLLLTVSKAVDTIVERELGMKYRAEDNEYARIADPNWASAIVPETQPGQMKANLPKFHFDGRLTVPEKVVFMGTARKEVIELGVRLRTFADYFFSSNEKAYKAHIISLLKRNISVKCYLLDPESDEAALYFKDRARVMPSEKTAIQETMGSIEKLREILREFAAEPWGEHFQIYLYQHIPYNLFLAVDPDAPNGKMLISHYIYGIRRAECVVWEIDLHGQPDLYAKYHKSLHLYIKDAKKLDITQRD